MAYSSERASLEGIPPEIRFNIYQYLLSDRNVIVIKPNGVLRPRYQTSLFTVNKKISTESLAYFCSENGFVSMKTDLGPFLLGCAQEIPLFVGDRVNHFKHPILSVSIIRDGTLDKTEPEWLSTAIFASRHLSNFVRLFNTEHPGIAGSSQTTDVHLLYRTKGNFFTPKRSALDCVVDGIKGIRSVDNIPGGGHLQITVDGDLGVQTAEDIKASVDTCAPTKAITLDQALQVKRRGDDFYKAGDPNAARGEYLIAIRIIYATYTQEWEDDLSQYKLKCLLFKLFKLTSDLNTKQGLHRLAVRQAEMALHMGTVEAHLNSRTAIRLNGAQTGQLYYRLGCALINAGIYKQALDKLIKAHLYLPEREDIMAKLLLASVRWHDEDKQRHLAYHEAVRLSAIAIDREEDELKRSRSWLRRVSNRIRSTRGVRLDVRLDWVTRKVRKVQQWAKDTA